MVVITLLTIVLFLISVVYLFCTSLYAMRVTRVHLRAERRKRLERFLTETNVDPTLIQTLLASEDV